MTWKWGRGLAMAGAGLAVLGALACSSSDPIEPNNGTMALSVTVAPAYSDATYQRAQFQIDQITLRPRDPLSNSYLGIPLGLLQTPLEGNLREGGTTMVSNVPLKAGTYELEAIRISSLELSDVDQDFGDAVRCSNGELLGARPQGITLLQFAQPPLLQLVHGSPTALELTVDGPGLVNMIVNLPYDCVQRTIPTPTTSQLAPFISLN